MFFRKNKTYLISYNFTDKDNRFGFGRICTILKIKNKITLCEELEEYVKKLYEFKNVVVLNICEIK